MSSWKNAPKEFRPEWNFSEEWQFAKLKNNNMRENYFGYKKWCDVASLFFQLKTEYPDRVYVLNYSDLLTNTIKEIENIFDFSGIGKPNSQTIEFINKSKSINHLDPNSVYKTKINDDEWKSDLPQNIIDEIKNDSTFKLFNEKFNWLENEF